MCLLFLILRVKVSVARIVILSQIVNISIIYIIVFPLYIGAENSKAEMFSSSPFCFESKSECQVINHKCDGTFLQLSSKLVNAMMEVRHMLCSTYISYQLEFMFNLRKTNNFPVSIFSF